MTVTTYEPPATGAAALGRKTAKWPGLLRGRREDPVWVRPALLGLLVATAALYIWGLDASGWSNSFYSAAVQAGTRSWKAFFFGSFDSANFITVDKPPGSLWPMELSARIFGLNSWSLLVPQALEGVATVALAYAAVRRWFRPGPALLAAAIAALTPVAVLMFRFNNPDALLVLLLTAAGYATMRAIDSGRTRWVVLAGALVGFGFLAKELQTLLVVPAIGLAYLVAGPPKLGRRILQLLAGGVVLVVAAGWWIAAVQLTPAADRPYIGGSQNNSLWNVVFGYNGFGRLNGNESGSVLPGGRTGPGMWGPTGWERLFQAQMGGQISWLVPAALGVLVIGLWWTRRHPRTDRSRAALLLWGGSLVVTAVVFSFSKGIIHPYYTIALAPLVGITLACGLSLAWDRRHHLAGRAVMAAVVLGSALWSAVLLDRTPNWYPWLRVVVVVAGAIAATVIVAWPVLRARPLRAIAGAAGVVALLAGPAAYSGATVALHPAGAIPSAGPAGAGGAGFGPGGGFRGFPGLARGARGTRDVRPRVGLPGASGVGAARGSFLPAGVAANGRAGGAFFPGSGVGPAGFVPGAAGSLPTGGAGGFPGLGGRAARTGRAPGGFGGGLFGNATVAASTAKALSAGSAKYTWVLATMGATSGAPYQLALGKPVMAIGGFNGTDPAPSLSQFQSLVRQGRIHYFLASGAGGFGAFGGGGRSSTSTITTWVEQHFVQKTVGGLSVYDLSDPK